MLVVVIVLFIAALWVDASWRIALALLVWTPALFTAVAAMHCTAALHLPDPLAPLYAFGLGALAARTITALAIDVIRER